MNPPATDDLVILVHNGRDIGTANRLHIHTTNTPLHRAFSTYLRRDDGRVLITRRALTKTTWPGVWTNTACGHPRPGETPTQAATRRVPEELGTPPLNLRTKIPNFTYRATDASGIVENEICPVLVGEIDHTTLNPNPNEVTEHAWVHWEDLRHTARTMPHLLSPWSVLQINALGDNPW
ncbi:isopentenyl-diphosphate Delta-isomerase [Dermatophilus congolensis]|uniref:isopentenyl-diphosphate Delta-isomerase n=1 Tax=Dermatophilus congolensis TaxID=1863 RepID=UPI001AB00938|nr:isopentenyl-diphosphate Delta-isomerase [Dermatophilus congolensis]